MNTEPESPKKINYSDLEQLHYDIENPISMQLIEYNLQKSLSLWKEKFDAIKDSSWPSCHTFEDFYKLPTHIQTECVNIHKFSPEIWKKSIADDAFESFSMDTPEHVKYIMTKYSDIIVGKDIVDFACNTGVYSFACWEAGAKSVLGFDIRDSNILMANAIKNYLDIHDDQLKFVKADIHDHKMVSQMCKNKDTVLIPGVLYHVHDHYEILNAVAENRPKNIVIETGESEQIMDSQEPLVWWRLEPTFENTSGWHKNLRHVPVGYPNLSWFEMIAGQLGYRLVGTKRHTVSPSKNNVQEFARIRSIQVYELDGML